MANAAKVEALSFEDALNELETLVRSLESGNTPLEQSIEAYERGVALKKHCETKLKEARLKIEKITISPDGTPKATEVDPESF
ncbi:MAG: exodeoxyribonuclease VII small subunit [Pseudobdellovibrionaceae bacterium]